MSKNEMSLIKVFNNSTWMIAIKIVNIILGLVVSVCVTRYLGVEQRGQMAEASAIASFYSFIASFGLLDIMISKFSTDREKSGAIAASGMAIMFCGGIVAFLLAVISAIILGVEMCVLLYVAVDGIVYIFQCFSVYEYWFYSNSNSKNYAIAQFIIHLLFLGIRCIGVPLHEDLTYFVVTAVFETTLVYLAQFICYKINRCYFNGKFAFDKQIALELIKLALPMVAMGFATTIYMKIDQIMVGKLMGNHELGLYSVAVNLAEYWYFVPAAIYSSFLPLLTECYSSKKAFKKMLQQFADIMILIGYSAALGVMVFGRWGVLFLYGIEFERSAYILMIYIWSGVFTCLSYVGQAYYIIHRDTKTVMWINLAGAFLNFILNLVLIRYYGSIGAALATLLEYMFIACGQMIVLRKKYGDLYIIQIKALFPFKRILSYIIKVC